MNKGLLGIFKIFVARALPWLAISMWLVISLGAEFIQHTYYTEKSHASSPNNEFTVFEFHSVSESGQAPYGDYLLISKKLHINDPENAMVVFAGYCRNQLKYSWASNAKIEFSCPVKDAGEIRTLVRKVYGISIEMVSNNAS